MPKPSGDWLKEDVGFYASLGIVRIISLIEPEEVEELNLKDQKRICESFGLGFVSFPIPDYGLPDPEPFSELADETRHDIEGGASVAIHCRAGIGRSGMLSCTIIAPWFGAAQTAIDHVTKARGVKVPDTEEQRNFVIQLFDPSWAERDR